MLNKSHVAIVGCSNPLPDSAKNIIGKLENKLQDMGLTVEVSNKLYISDYADAKARSSILMDSYSNKNISAIFDVSGGDMANEILPYIDFDIIKNNPKMFFGYSDLTTIINAIYEQTKCSSILYQIRNIVTDNDDVASMEIADIQKENFLSTFVKKSENELVKELEKELEKESKKEQKNTLMNKMLLLDPLGAFSYRYIQGENLEGIVVGGNIRCLLKLAGTRYFPNVEDKILFLEARSGDIPQMITYISQLSQMGVFKRIRGMVLGTFTTLDSMYNVNEIERLVLEQVDATLPIIRTLEVGHGTDSKAFEIGGYYIFENVIKL